MPKVNQEWRKIARECAKDFSMLSNSGITTSDMPSRGWIRAWMQSHYSIIKLSGYFFRLFKTEIENPSKDNDVSESLNEDFIKKAKHKENQNTLDKSAKDFSGLECARGEFVTILPSKEEDPTIRSLKTDIFNRVVQHAKILDTEYDRFTFKEGTFQKIPLPDKKLFDRDLSIDDFVQYIPEVSRFRIDANISYDGISQVTQFYDIARKLKGDEDNKLLIQPWRQSHYSSITMYFKVNGKTGKKGYRLYLKAQLLVRPTRGLGMKWKSFSCNYTGDDIPCLAEPVKWTLNENFVKKAQYKENQKDIIKDADNLSILDKDDFFDNVCEFVDNHPHGILVEMNELYEPTPDTVKSYIIVCTPVSNAFQGDHIRVEYFSPESIYKKQHITINFFDQGFSIVGNIVNRGNRDSIFMYPGLYDSDVEKHIIQRPSENNKYTPLGRLRLCNRTLYKYDYQMLEKVKNLIEQLYKTFYIDKNWDAYK